VSTNRAPGACRVCCRSSQSAQGVPPQHAAAAPRRPADDRARRDQLRDRPRRVHRRAGPERLRQVDARPHPLDADPSGRRRRPRVRKRRRRGRPGRAPAGQPRLGRGLVLQEDVAGREPVLCSALLRPRHSGDAAAHPGDPRPGRLSALPPGLPHGAAVARHAAEGRPGPGAADLPGAAAARRADDRPRPALEARGAGLHPGHPRGARHDDPALHTRHARGRDPGRADRDPRARPAAAPGAGRRTARALRGELGRGSLPGLDRQVVRGRGRGREPESERSGRPSGTS